MKKPKEDEGRVFALDIGTRSVIGIIGRQEGDVFYVEHTDREEYKTRAVVDGQIEDIDDTARVAAEVKRRLERSFGAPLKSVYVAAAGRVLRTVRCEGSQLLEAPQVITEREVDELERDVVKRAYERLSRENDNHDFFCVGYSVRSYTLDGYAYSSLIGHRGRELTASLIVTFLPKEVVDSLYTTMNQIGLTVAGLTLEPIAAMNAIVPQDLRKLNIALCDIGAGTSDIALCENGSIKSYGVATVAGDEITEAVMHSCLVDFETAESVKKQLGPEGGGRVKYENILGLTVECSSEEVIAGILEAVDALASTISDIILHENGHIPDAVFLVGGGSRTPGLRARLASAMGIDEDRIAVGGRVHMKRMFASEYDISGPDFATPLGIAWTAAQRSSAGSLAVTINGKKLHLFNVWDSTVLGVLQTAGYRYAQIVGRNGRSVTFTLNGRRRTEFGGLPTLPVVTLNGRECKISDTVGAGDVITFEPSAQGEDARVLVRDLVKDPGETFEITYLERPYTAGTCAFVNGAARDGDFPISNGDEVTIRTVLTLGDLRREEDVGETMLAFVGGQLRTDDYRLKAGDRAVFVMPRTERRQTRAAEENGGPRDTADGGVNAGKPGAQSAPAARQTAGAADEPVTAPLSVGAEGKKPAAVRGTEPHAASSSQPRAADAAAESPGEGDGPLHITLNGREVELTDAGSGIGPQFYDLLALVDLDFEHPEGAIVLKLNGRDAAYTDRLCDGDVATIEWEGRVTQQ